MIYYAGIGLFLAHSCAVGLALALADEATFLARWSRRKSALLLGILFFESTCATIFLFRVLSGWAKAAT